MQPKQIGCERRRVSGLTTKIVIPSLDLEMCSKTYKLHMLWVFGKNKRIGITKSPVPKFLDTGLNVVCSWPWSQLVIEPIYTKFSSMNLDQPETTSRLPKMLSFEQLFLASFELDDGFSILTMACSIQPGDPLVIRESEYAPET